LSQLALLFVPHWVHALLHWLSLHWGDVMPAWLAVIVAAVFGWQSWRSSRRSAAAERESRAAEREARQQADPAITAAGNAADAADRSLAAPERSATTHETQAQLAQDQADAAERFPWRIERRVGQDFRLINLTSTRKYDVGVTGEPVRGKGSGVFRAGGGRGNRFDVVDGRETVELDLFIAMQTVDRSVTVSWRPTPDHTGDSWTQRIGLQ
jgi:hypothetical protein